MAQTQTIVDCSIHHMDCQLSQPISDHEHLHHMDGETFDRTIASGSSFPDPDCDDCWMHVQTYTRTPEALCKLHEHEPLFTPSLFCTKHGDRIRWALMRECGYRPTPSEMLFWYKDTGDVEQAITEWKPTVAEVIACLAECNEFFFKMLWARLTPAVQDEFCKTISVDQLKKLLSWI